MSKSGSQEVRKSGRQEVRESGNQEVRKSGSQEVRKSGSQDVRKSGSKEVRESGSQEVRKSGNQEVSKSASDLARLEDRAGRNSPLLGIVYRRVSLLQLLEQLSPVENPSFLLFHDDLQKSLMSTRSCQ